jgi:hypothetical protein
MGMRRHNFFSTGRNLMFTRKEVKKMKKKFPSVLKKEG